MSCTRYTRNGHEASIDDEEERVDSMKAYIIQLLKGVIVVNAGIAAEGETMTRAQNEDANKNFMRIKMSKNHVGDANKQQDINGANKLLL